MTTEWKECYLEIKSLDTLPFDREPISKDPLPLIENNGKYYLKLDGHYDDKDVFVVKFRNEEFYIADEKLVCLKLEPALIACKDDTFKPENYSQVLLHVNYDIEKRQVFLYTSEGDCRTFTQIEKLDPDINGISEPIYWVDAYGYLLPSKEWQIRYNGSHFRVKNAQAKYKLIDTPESTNERVTYSSGAQRSTEVEEYRYDLFHPILCKE